MSMRNLLFLVTIASVLHPISASAEPAPQSIGCFDDANRWCLVPATAVGWQINLRDGGVSNGALLTGLSLQHEFGSIPMGLGIYAGLGASSANERSYHGCMGISITNWGMACIGVQRATFHSGASAWQGMLTLAAQLTFGGTPSYVRAAP